MASNRIYGGNDINLGLLSGANGGTGQGVYSRSPGSTPKYNTGNDVDSVTSQARLFVDVADNAAYSALRAKVPERARRLFDVLSPQSGARSTGYFDFLLESVNSSRQEKMQVTEVLSDAFVAYFFGERAPLWSFSGNLLNTQQDEWYDAWHILYADILRGSKLAQYGIPARIFYNGREVTGYITATSESFSARQETAVSFQFQMLVKRVRIRPDLAPNNPSKGYTTQARVDPATADSFSVETVTSLTLSTQELTLNDAVPVFLGNDLARPVALDAGGNFGNVTTVRPGANENELKLRGGLSGFGPRALNGSDM